MTIPEDVLRTSIANLSDAELRKRWESQQFTEAALPIAETEIRRRGLLEPGQESTAAMAPSGVSSADDDRSSAETTARSLIMGAFGAGGLVGSGALGVLVFGFLGLLLYRPLARLAARITKTRGALIAVAAGMAALIFVVVAIIAVVLGLIVRASL